MTEEEMPSPIKWLKYCAKKYPNVWKEIENIRKHKGKNGISKWPNWCYCPTSYVSKLISPKAPRSRSSINSSFIASRDEINAFIATTILTSWRRTQGIYRINSELFDSLVSTKITDDIPVEVLYHFPEWSVYIEFPENQENELFHPSTKGFFAYLDYNLFYSSAMLVILEDYGDRVHHYSIFLKDTIKGSLEETMRIAENDAIRLGHSIDEYKKEIGDPKEAVKSIIKTLSPFVSILLYLCSEAADIKNQNDSTFSHHQIKSRSLKSEFSNLPIYSPKVWEVGYRVGPTLNANKSQPTQPIESGNVNEPDSPNNPNGVRPHVRRAHYHGYWVGSGQEKKFILKWLYPILVGTKNPDEIVTTSREVL